MAILFLKEKKEGKIERKSNGSLLCLAKNQPNKNTSSCTYWLLYSHAVTGLCRGRWTFCAIQVLTAVLWSDRLSCQNINGKKKHMNKFIRSDYKPEYEHLMSTGIRTEVARISKSPYEKLKELKRSNSSWIFTLHNSSRVNEIMWPADWCRTWPAEYVNTPRTYDIKVIVLFCVNRKEMISDREKTPTDSLFLIIIIFFFWSNSSDKTPSSNCLLASLLGKPSWLLTQTSSPASKLLARMKIKAETKMSTWELN